jgi:VanZ family protein
MILVSIADELLQSAMHLGRTADILDFLADTIGIILGIITAPKIVTGILKRLKH